MFLSVGIYSISNFSNTGNVFLLSYCEIVVSMGRENQSLCSGPGKIAGNLLFTTDENLEFMLGIRDPNFGRVDEEMQN